MGVTLERTVKQLARLAFFDVRNILDDEGNPLPLGELDEDTAAAITAVEVAILPDKGDDAPTTKVVRYRFSDRARPLDMLMQHLNGYKVHREAPLDPLVQLLQGMRRSAVPVVAEIPSLEHDRDEPRGGQ